MLTNFPRQGVSGACPETPNEKAAELAAAKLFTLTSASGFWFGSGPDASSQGRHNGNLGEDQEQDAQPLRNAKQANSNPYHSDHDCIIFQRDRRIRSLGH